MNTDEDFADEDLEPNPGLRALTNRIIGCAIAVHRAIGPGFAETVYQKALELEFAAHGVVFLAQAPLRVKYRDVLVGEGRADLIVAGLVVVELKSVDELASVHIAQTLSYLRASGLKVGILINFNVKKLVDGVRRVSL